ncbi:phosphatidate cytidylyltransferase [Sporolactobacillus terrae]|uniref:phosphatidate cytidylyltransferase n=1 Tax=Sporolactobacillus terrae TaxID=269673 RepID=UPI00048A7DEA|nr:phosphatidate cytidylyltransferase [Sporolactobacillus terrae]
MKQRITTGLLAGAFYLVLLCIGSLPFTLLAAAIAVISYLELVKMGKMNVASPEVIFGGLAVAALVLNAGRSSFLADGLWMRMTALFVLLMLTLMILRRSAFTFANAAYLFLSVFYIGIPFYLLVRLRLDSLLLVLLVQVLIWTTDSGAYFVGRKFGKRKLAPVISPNKTREGSIGAVIIAVLIALLFKWIAGPALALTWPTLIGISLVISVFGQIGDLVESAIKRYYNIKDSGTILPGHGGMLDRFDSLIFVLPLLYVLGFIV